jgi:hypothetical protein
MGGSERGGTGRRAGFRSRSRKRWEFESPRSHERWDLLECAAPVYTSSSCVYEDVHATAPRGSVSGAELERKKLSGVLVLHFADGSEWAFDVPKIYLSTAEGMVATISRQRPKKAGPMADDVETTASDHIRTSLEAKLSAFRETLTDDEFALLRGGNEVEGFTFNLAALSPTALGGSSSVIPAVASELTVTKTSTADKAATAADGYIRS